MANSEIIGEVVGVFEDSRGGSLPRFDHEKSSFVTDTEVHAYFKPEEPTCGP